jgi:hypothetical protein
LLGAPNADGLVQRHHFEPESKVTVNRMVPYGTSKGEESKVHCQMEKSWLQSSEMVKVLLFLPRGDEIELHLLF